jgi:hypothetical protein
VHPFDAFPTADTGLQQVSTAGGMRTRGQIKKEQQPTPSPAPQKKKEQKKPSGKGGKKDAEPQITLIKIDADQLLKEVLTVTS